MITKLIFLYGFITLILVNIDQGRKVVNAEHRLVVIVEDFLLAANLISFLLTTIFFLGTTIENAAILLQLLVAVCTTTYYSLLKEIDVDFELTTACMNTAWIVLLIPVILL